MRTLGEPPGDLDTRAIGPAPLSPSGVYHVLVSDGSPDAGLFRKQFLKTERPRAPDHVILGLTPALSPNIAGLAYYKVIRRQDDYDAIALGTHFRPHQALERADKRRLL